MKEKFLLKDDLLRLVEIVTHVDRDEIVEADINYVKENLKYGGQWLIYLYYYYAVHDVLGKPFDLEELRTKLMKLRPLVGAEVRIRIAFLLDVINAKEGYYDDVYDMLLVDDDSDED